MTFHKSMVQRLCLYVAAALLSPPTLFAQTTKISTEYLMTLYAPLDAAEGEVLTSKDMYFVIAPTMQTSAKKYDWLNGVQCIGKMVSYKSDAYVKYEIFVVR
jgi:hypothetical protein